MAKGESAVDVEDNFESTFTDAVGELPEAPVESSEVESPAEVESPEEPGSPPEEQPADEPSSLDSLLGMAREIGLSIEGIASEAELSRKVMETIRAMQPQVKYAREAYQRERQQQAAVPAPVVEEPKDWTPERHFAERFGGPEWRDDYTKAIQAGVVQRDDNGLWVSTPGYESLTATFLPDMNASQQHTAQFWQDLTRGNPLPKLYGALADPIERMVTQRVEAILTDREGQSKRLGVIEKFEQDHGSWLYTKDPQTGERVNTEDGQRFVDAYKRIQSEGVTDPARILHYAQLETGLGRQDEAARTPPTTQVNTQASIVADRSGQETQQKSFLENARRRAEHAPSARARADEEAPQTMTESDLNSFFERAVKGQSRK